MESNLAELCSARLAILATNRSEMTARSGVLGGPWVPTRYRRLAAPGELSGALLGGTELYALCACRGIRPPRQPNALPGLLELGQDGPENGSARNVCFSRRPNPGSSGEKSSRSRRPPAQGAMPRCKIHRRSPRLAGFRSGSRRRSDPQRLGRCARRPGRPVRYSRHHREHFRARVRV